MKRYFLLFALILGQCFAQVPVTPIVQPHVTFVNADGAPCAGCSLFSYAAGTTTPLATYKDAAGTSQNTNPIVLDAAGGADILLGGNSYKLILKDASGATIWTVDQVNSGHLLPCASANAIQAANTGVNGLNCDPSITINPITHTINIGTLPTNHVTIGALGTPTLWTLDTTSPTTAWNSMSSVEDATGFAGADIGAQINAAFASCTGSNSCTVTLPPGHSYSFAAPIQIPSNSSSPAIAAPKLDCQGSTINFTGTGDAIVVHGENASGPATTGGIYNCSIQSATPHSTSITSLIHIKGRIGFTLSRLHLQNAQYCVDWENTNTDGGPGYNEQDNFEHIESSGCSIHLYAHSGSGSTGSFEYNKIDDWHFTLNNSNGAEYGFGLMGGTTVFDTQGGVFDFKMNTQGTTGGPMLALVYITGGNHFYRSVVNLHGENTASVSAAYSVYVDSGTFYNAGNAVLSGLLPFVNSSSIFNKYALHPALSHIVSDIGSSDTIHYEPEIGQGGSPERECKFDIGDDARFWLAKFDGSTPDCAFQILGRVTDSTNANVYLKGAGANAPFNLFYTSVNGVGVGPGFGPTATGGAEPAHTLEVNGTLAVNGRSHLASVDALSLSSNTVGSSDLAGALTLTGGTGSYTFLVTTHSQPPICVASDSTAANAVKVVASSTAVTFTGTGTDSIQWVCVFHD